MTQYSGKIIRKTPVVPTQQAASGVWTVTDAAAAVKNNIWPVAGVPDPISRSVRLRSSASAYFNNASTRTVAPGAFTFSMWFKRGTLTTAQTLFQCADAGGASNKFGSLALFADDTLRWVHWTGADADAAKSNGVLRDPSAWYHAVFSKPAGAVGTLYLNGVAQTKQTSYSNDTDIFATTKFLGRQYDGIRYFDGYMAEVYAIDGQALTASSFGTTDPATGAWIPMAYTGTYGSGGYYLDFKDNTSTTTLGYDYSGNSNNWTANNISLTAGATYDSMLDVPTPWVGYNTDGGVSVTRGNYATLNPLTMNPSYIVSGNLNVTNSAASPRAVSSIGMTSGKWYWEATTTNTSYFMSSGLWKQGANTTELLGYADALTWGWYAQSGQKWFNNANTAWGSAFTSVNDVLGVAFDADTGDLFFYKNGTLQGGGAAFTGLTSGPYFAGISTNGGGTTSSINFGQRPFSYTPPTGFKALCTTNLPDPTIKLGAQYMAASTYTGNGSTQSIVNSGNNTTATTFQPDLVWLKQRSSPVAFNLLYDATRGVGNYLSSNTTGAEGTIASSMTAFNSNGFSVGADPSGLNNGWNASGLSMVGWQWKAAGASVSNTSGTITSTVNAGTTQGFSVVTYTGSGSAATVGHGLGATPSMIIIKRRDSTSNWITYHTSTGINQYLYLNSTAAAASTSPTWSVSSTTFGLPQSFTDYNASGGTYVAYCFAEVAGYSKFGSYTGNSSADGTFVYCGFRPRFVMVKGSSGVTNWFIWDSSRDTYNVANKYLLPNSSSAEDTTSGEFDILSNGFKFRANNQANTSGVTYIFAAFAETPFKYSNAR